LTQVRRADLHPILQAPGRLDSSQRTVVRCELENVAGGATAGASTLISLLAEGSQVRRGDVLARLDASSFEEMLRQQTILVEQAKASQLQARLSHEVALITVREFSEGTVKETLQTLNGGIALARSDLARATGRLAWTKHMNEKGYASLAAISTDRDTVSRLEFSLERQLASLDLFVRFTQPITLKMLQTQVTSAQAMLDTEDLRLGRQLERLAFLKKQVDRCTIRAPRDGVLFYVKDERRNILVEEGMAVRQSQALFYLPDLNRMEVTTALNESVVDRVSPGMSASISLEAFPDLVLPGRVLSVGQIPNRQSDRGEDVRFFFGIVTLDRVPPNLRPGMSAKVDITLARRDDVLVVPHEAVAWLGGKKVCYVAHDDTLVRRDVITGQGTTDLVEVDSGLHEGELVVVNPRSAAGIDESVRNAADAEADSSLDNDALAASHR
jgi:HlyD family secretion protein